MRQVQPAFAFRRPSPVVLTTMVALFALWIAWALGVRFVPAVEQIYAQLVLSPPAVLHELKLWQLLSYPLVETLVSPTPMLFTLLGLYFFGTELELRWGKPRFLLFMALATLAGGVFATAAWGLGLSMASGVAGAQTIVLGLLVAWGLTFRDRTIHVFFVLPMRGIHVVWLTVAFQVLSAISLGAASTAAHFGGMAMAAALTLGVWRGNRAKLWWDDLLVKLRLRKEPKLYVVPKQQPRGPERYHIN